MEQPNFNPFVVDTKESENPSVYNDEAPSNPSSQYQINLALVKKLRSDRKAVAEAELGTQSRAQWYKALKETPEETPGYPDLY